MSKLGNHPALTFEHWAIMILCFSTGCLIFRRPDCLHVALLYSHSSPRNIRGRLERAIEGQPSIVALVKKKEREKECECYTSLGQAACLLFG